MTYKSYIFIYLGVVACIATLSQAVLPEGFVKVKQLIPDIDVELRYYSNDNFVGDTIDGYKANVLVLTEAAAQQLKLVQDDLQQRNLCLKVYDGYRPQRAVNHFVRWAKDLRDTINKQEFYPDVPKQYLFKEEYIASRSGHSRGSTLDLTITNGETGVPLDMGSAYDFFGKESWVDYKGISNEQQANRQLLQEVMLRYGFRNYPKEWWHFTLRNEPFKTTYFDFVIE